jgi:hypothetical protein
MNLSEIRTKVREVVDMDSTDLSDALLNMYIIDGYERMIALDRRWPFFEKSWTLTTVAEQPSYLLSGIGTGDVREVTSVVDNSAGGLRLTMVDHTDGEALWLGSNDVSGTPRHFSIWQQSLYLWPKPETAVTLYLRGYRKPTAWHDNDATEVDADERLHQSLVYYAIAQVYQLQEELEVSGFYRQSFDEAVRLAAADILRVPSHRPLVFSGSRFHDSLTGHQQPLYY